MILVTYVHPLRHLSHSHLITLIASSRLARRAGIELAATATIARSTATKVGMMTRFARLAVLCLSLVALYACGPGLSGQGIKKSQEGSVGQKIAHTEVAIRYSRPVARGRTLFGPGGVVPYGEEWNPGADNATRIEISRDVTVEGHELPAGSYSMWAIPRRDRWTIILSEAADVWHVPYPGEARDVLRFDVTPGDGSHMETLAFYFPVVDGNEAELRLHWGEVVVPMSIVAER